MNNSMDAGSMDKTNGDRGGSSHMPQNENDHADASASKNENGEANSNLGQGGFDGQVPRQDGNTPPNDNDKMNPQVQSVVFAESFMMIGISLFVLVLGLISAFIYKRRK